MPAPVWEVREGEALDLLRALPAGSVDAVVTDPPYASGGTSAAERTTQTAVQKYVSSDVAIVRGPDFAGDQRDQRSHTMWSTMWMSLARRAAMPGAMLVVFSDWRQEPATTDAVQAAGWVWRGTAVWSKPNARPRRGAFRNAAEFIVWATNGAHRPPADAPYLPGVIEASAPRGAKRVHITQKPAELLDVLVRVAGVGHLVLDPFMGSGTTGVAAVNAGRRFLGFEVVPHYLEIARERIAAAALGRPDPPID
jgi:site-specific DNA-methyltransferase (adenine-specific)